MRSWAAALLVCVSPAVAASEVPAPDVDVGQLSLKRLLDIDVTSVSKRSQRLMDVATSIYVITEEDIRRSGATRLQDALKLAPGAWVSDDSYTISAFAVREGAHPFSQTLLWILDGVPITNPVTGGLITDVLDLPLADIQRIEVIKGPGGTIYGANAASGIVSIFTKGGEATDGVHAVLEGGTQGYVSPYLRYGFEPRENLFVSAWGKYKRHDGFDRNPMFSGDSLWAVNKAGAAFLRPNRFQPAPDDNQEALSGGAKWDWQPVDRWRWTGGLAYSDVASGKYLIRHVPWPDSNPDPRARYDHPAARQEPSEDQRQQVIAQTRLDYAVGEGHGFFVNAYHWRHEHRWMGGTGYNNDYNITDLELQDNVEAFGSHRFSVGANLRRVQYDFTALDGGRTPQFRKGDRTAWLMGSFIQDEVALGPRWRVTFGAKAETWTLLGYEPEVSPSMRVVYKATPDLTFWAAAGRSITTPSFSQFDMELRVQQLPAPWYFQAQGMADPPDGAGKWVAIVSGGDVKPGEYYTLEGGHRGMLGSSLQWDLSGFYSWARDQVSITPMDESLNTVVPSLANPGDSVVPIYNANLWEYENFGGEALVRLLPVDFLRLELSWAVFFQWNYRGLPIPGDPEGRSLSTEDLEVGHVGTPRHVGRLKAYVDLPWAIDLTLHGTATTSVSRGARFNYFSQRPDPLDGVEVAPTSPLYLVDASLQRSFFRDRVLATVWGRNLLAWEPYTEYFNQYVWSSYPHHVHWTFGGGLEYRF